MTTTSKCLHSVFELSDSLIFAMEELHIHCLKCVNRRCMIRPEPNVSCDLMGCPLVCGAVFHSCKLNEHRLLCPYERVPCLNCGFGCPFNLARVKMAQHLETCPASIVCCTMEWNRWPVSYADRKSYDNLSKEVCDVEQLDMALALQDQRMLLESLKVVTTVTKALEEQNQDSSSRQESNPENEFIEMDEEPYGGPYTTSVENRRSFAVTLDVLRSAKNIDFIVENTNGEEQNGGCSGVRNGDGEFSNETTKESDTDSDSDLGAVGGADCPFPVDPEDERDDWLENSGCGDSSEEEGEMNGGIELSELHNEGDGVSQVRLERVNGSSNARQVLSDHSIPVLAQEPEMAHLPQLPLPLPIPVPNLMHNNVLHHLPFRIEDRWLERKLENLQALRGMNLFTIKGRRTLFSDPYLFKAKMEDKAVDTSDLEVADDLMGLHGIDLITAALLFCLGDSPGGRGISDCRFVDGYRIDFGTQTFSLPSAILATSTMVGDIASASACDHASPQLSNPSPFHTLRLDLVLECVARYQTKQRSMFTFVCGQLFRRDEFSSHFKNVHGDIHAGLNGWMEQRCPLAYYGCTYSQRRFCPSVQGFRVIHDRHLGSFGVQPGLAACPNEPLSRTDTCQFRSHCDHLSDLPFELLQYIASFLDGFSLCQLSIVSRTMRDVCASLLQSRGMVVLLWEKTKQVDGTSSWQIQDKVWRFSTAFDTVNEWKFANISSMADHLKMCTFNTITRREEAVPLPCMSFTRELTKEGRSLRSVLKPVI
ncbi:F-box only protein 30-like isoform X1 [Sinocyclocheilus anshuiensis]|uniref:F-box only protein 30-like n=1 Tax=Sinocyclocheilus anshuiensis TaxID=1608454 RepID=A0A671NGH5_9TELE|nr:PREDICTED: F-box only protein 30-like isoform X1 [Sinocyclocheilus anshuiensis]